MIALRTASGISLFSLLDGVSVCVGKELRRLHAEGGGDIQELVQQHGLPPGLNVGDRAAREFDSRRKLQLGQTHRGTAFAHLGAKRPVNSLCCANSCHVRRVDSRGRECQSAKHSPCVV